MQEKVSRKHQEISELIWGITETRVKWDSNVQQLNNTVYLKAKNLGIIKKCANCQNQLWCEFHSIPDFKQSDDEIELFEREQ